METITPKQNEFLDYLFGENKHPIESDEDYRTLELIFDEEE